VSNGWRESMLQRLDKREKQILTWTGRLRRQIEAGTLGGEPGRIWLDQFAVGHGLNIACGDFPIGESLGVDTDPAKIAIDFWGFGDSLQMVDHSIDFVVTNYLECFPDTLKVLSEWYRVLRGGGTLAMVCCNSDKYDNSSGPLANRRRLHCFTEQTLRFYLERVGFSDLSFETCEKELRVVALA